MTVDEVSALMAAMVVHGATRVTVGDVTIERPLPDPTSAAREVDPFEKLKRMDPSAQDRALMLDQLRRSA